MLIIILIELITYKKLRLFIILIFILWSFIYIYKKIYNNNRCLKKFDILLKANKVYDISWILIKYFLVDKFQIYLYYLHLLPLYIIYNLLLYIITFF